MTRKRTVIFQLLFCITIIFIFIVSVKWVYPQSTLDITSKLDLLGNPLSKDGKKGRALNVWDLQVFNGKIYVAGGSTVENAGPINVWAYNPTKGSFDREYTVDEEAIEHFKVFDKELYIPAADPRLGNSNKFYRKTGNGKWSKYGSDSVSLAHVRDLLKTSQGDILMVGNNSQIEDVLNPAIAITTDNGNSFQAGGASNIPPKTNLIDFNWFFSVFSYQNKIYASSSVLRDFQNLAGSIAVYDPVKKNFSLDFKLKNSEFIPDQIIGSDRHSYGENIIYRLWNPLEYKNSLVYGVRSYSNNPDYYQTSYLNSIGFYLKQKMGKTPIAIEFPDRQSMGEDALVINNELYALANRKISATSFIISVYKTNNPAIKNNWQEIGHFKNSNKARSFEYLDGKFYFGLGQDINDPIAKSGNILSYQLR